MQLSVMSPDETRSDVVSMDLSLPGQVCRRHCAGVLGTHTLHAAIWHAHRAGRSQALMEIVFDRHYMLPRDHWDYFHIGVRKSHICTLAAARPTPTRSSGTLTVCHRRMDHAGSAAAEAIRHCKLEALCEDAAHQAAREHGHVSR